ncbi:uncharacterized protein (DUF1778 family) [Rhizobium pisi]|uniref:Uncharacterized protein (DUF1778 family) n=2 Tax=Rhizobium pisi TaxID=574561 RepID=A0A7W5BSE7_9HYPH|nr:DUF1778 domain-containing protein [Rhizobium pisi]MBB3138281.1 uncharacterized protein (DUF1778 family) [Rhizobium pisi]
MPRVAVEDNERMSLRIAAAAKAKLVRAAALRNTDLTNFVTQSALREADSVIAEAEVIKASERDYGRILELLENPPQPNDKLLAAAGALPKSI